MAKSISGETAWNILVSLVSDNGLTQIKIAELCGLSRQGITDIKSGRRNFTKKMADSIVKAGVDEPWGLHLKKRLEYAFNPPIYEGLEELFNDDANKKPLHPTFASYSLPILTALPMDDPLESTAFSGEYLTLPPIVAEIAQGLESPYILRLQSDDCYKRLRQGDHLLVAQAYEVKKEIVVIAHAGTLRLARTVADARQFYNFSGGFEESEGWVALDSGRLITNAEQVACVFGIVWAAL